MDITSLGKNPVTPEQPAGSDVRYEAEFERLQAEIDKTNIPSASGGGIDWKKVGDLSEVILSKKSKDLLVACYLAVSQIHLRKLDGLKDGVTVLHDIIQSYWEDLFPPKKRIRGRSAAIEWWIEKSEAALGAIKPDPVAIETLDTIKNTLSQIDSLLVEYLPEPPLLRPIQRRLEQFPTLAPKEPVQAPLEETSQPEPLKQAPELKKAEQPKAAPVNAETMAINTEQDARKMISSSMLNIRKSAAFLLENNPASPLAYRYRRMAAWAQVLDLPPASNGKTQIMSPAPQAQQTLIDLRDNGQWKPFIFNAEQQLSQLIFWFDLNRWVAEALLELGDEYKAAHNAVCHETASFINRLPNLLELTFSDETPFADYETREWLNGICGDRSPEQKSNSSPKNSDKNKDNKDQVLHIQGKAEALAKKKKFPEAVGLFQIELKNCSSQKEAMILRIALCQMLFKSKRMDMTIPHLDLIINDIDVYRLENWDPELAVEGLKLVWMVSSKQTDTALKEKAKAILSRIAKIDPVEAMKLGNS